MKKPRTYAGTIWTTLGDLAHSDLVRNQALYTLDDETLHPWPTLPEHVIELPADISLSGKRAWVQSPDGFGPTHEIALWTNCYFSLTKKEWLLEHLHSATFDLYYFNAETGVLSGDHYEPYRLSQPTLADIFKLYEDLPRQLERISKYMEALKAFL